MKNIQNCAKGYLERDILPSIEKEGREYRFMGIFSKTREEYTISEFAGHYLGATIIPLYDTLGQAGLEFILGETEISTIFTSDEGLCKLLKMEGILGNIKNIVVYDKIGEEISERIKEEYGEINCIEYRDILHIGENSKLTLPEDLRPNTDSIGLICYTSGTTGQPKGVKLTHKNMLAGATGLAHFEFMQQLNNSHCYISYLPMAHVMERLLQITCFYAGQKIGYFNGDISKLANDLVTLKPTNFVSVPRLYYRFYSVLTQKMADLKGFKKKLLDRALKTKLEKLRKTAIPTHKLYDALLFRKTKAILGGNIKFLGTGGAPIDKKVCSVYIVYI